MNNTSPINENGAQIIDHSNIQPLPNSATINIKPEKKIIAELVDEHIEELCKKLCYGNRNQYRCTVDASWSLSPKNAALCDWGNGSYDWMLNDLLYLHQLNERNNRQISLIENYYRKIIKSVSFWERYKNWRFKRRLRVPDYIKVLDPDARQVFWWLHDQDSIPNIAQRLGRNVADIRLLVADIQNELNSRKRNYLLNPNVEVSLEALDPVESNDVLATFQSEDKIEIHGRVKTAFQQLSWIEQFILDAMVIDNMQASSVLSALKAQSISLSEKYTCDEMNTQHIYYFLRKTIAKLKQLADIHDEH